MFSNISKTWELVDRLCLEVAGEAGSRPEGDRDNSLVGGTASAEGPEGEGTQTQLSLMLTLP